MSDRRKRFIKRAIFIVYLLAAYVFVARFGYDSLTSPMGGLGNAVPSGAVEDVTFASRGQSYLVHAFYVPGRGDYPALISVHGYRGGRHDEYHIQRAEALRDLGYTVVSLDLGGHAGDTVGKGRIGMGYSERWDVLGAFDYLLQRGFKPTQIGIVGESMGASTTLLAGAAEPRIRAVWADSGFYSVAAMIADRGKQSGYPALIIPLIPGGLFYGWLTTGDRLWEANAVDAANALAANKQAVYLIHDTGDEVVPYYHSQVLKAAYTAAGVQLTFWSIPDLGHVDGFMRERDEYLRRLDGFFHRHLEFAI